MERNTIWVCGVVVLWAAGGTRAADPPGLVTRKTDRGTIVGYKDTPKMPWTGDRYCVHDPDRPAPGIVSPAPVGKERKMNAAPSDAIKLFDGTDLTQWKPSSWTLKDGYVQAGEGSLETIVAFGSFQLHLEWAAPTEPASRFMSRGNSGVLLMGVYEIQVFDSWCGHERQIYPDGQAASVYGQTPPRVNVCRAPGEWQSFDIVFTAPEFRDGKIVRRPTVTVFHNGVLVHLNQEIYGPMAHRVILPNKPHPAKLPLSLQGHGSPVRYRNVWLRPLDG
mgnify:CR=1 FL=1